MLMLTRLLRTLGLSGFLLTGAAACGQSVCEQLADKNTACYAKVDCNTKSDATLKMTCETKKAESQVDHSGIACEEPIRSIAELCISKELKPEDDCVCHLN